MKRSKLWCAVIGATLLGGCAIGPDYQRPSIETPGAFKETSDWKIAEPRDEMARGKWWRIIWERITRQLVRRVAQNQRIPHGRMVIALERKR